MKHPDDKGWVERPPTPPSLPPAMDPHQMNATPPCPNATPEWAVAIVIEAEKYIQLTLFGDQPYNRKEFAAIIARHAPTAPLPTVAPHYAGLVERPDVLRYMGTRNDSTLMSVTDDERTLILAYVKSLETALTQLAPHAKHAGEVERLRVQLENQACIIRDSCTPVNIREERMLHELDQLRDKLAASEREVEGHWQALLAANERNAVEFEKWRTQLAASELDADALAGAANEVFRYLDIVEESDEGREFHPISFGCCRAMMVEPFGKALADLKALAAHRARGAAGGKQE